MPFRCFVSAACVAIATGTAALAQDTLGSWDRYTSFVMSSCIIDKVGLTAKHMAAMQARLGAGMIEHEDVDGKDYLDHENGTVLQLFADETMLECTVTIPADALSEEDAALLQADLDEQLGWAHNDLTKTEPGAAGEKIVTWRFAGADGVTVEVSYGPGEEGATIIHSTARVSE